MPDITASEGRHPLHTLISWPAVIAGAVVAIAIGAMLNLLGVALGAAALDPFDMTRADAAGFSVLGGAWVALSNAAALFAGGFVASRAARFSDHHNGLLHGLSVWALAFLVAMAIAGSTAMGGVTSALTGPNEVSAPSPAEVAASTVDAAASQAATPAGARDYPAVPPAAQPAISHISDATGTIALWAFLTMLLGGVGAVFGGRYGARRHPWETKARMVEPQHMAEARTETAVYNAGPST